MTAQKAGTCYFKGPLKGMRYTLRRLGLSVDQFKQLWAAVRIESVSQMAEQLCRQDKVVHYDAILSTDLLLVEATCRAASQIVVREASKASVPPRVLDKFKKDLTAIQSKLAEVKRCADAVNSPHDMDICARPGEVFVTQDSSLPLLLDSTDKTPFAGNAVQADAAFSPDFLSLPSGAVDSLEALIEELEATVALCNELSTTGTEQVPSPIHHLFITLQV